MTQYTVERRFRRFLLAVSAGLFTATALELVLIGHYEGWAQWVPFVLCGLGIASVVAAWHRPRRPVLVALRVVMAVVAAGSLFGVYWHVRGNWEFAREIRPMAPAVDGLWEAISGVNPLFASGILFLAALLGAAGTYQHPALRSAEA